MKIASIIVQVADIYKSHTFTSEVVTQALMNEEVVILDVYNNWSRVEQWDGYTGWINNFYLSKITESDRLPNYLDKTCNLILKSFPDLAEIRGEIISDSIKSLGIPYKWGGKSSAGYDCSGLVQMTFKFRGILMPRDSKDQYELVRENKVDLNEAEPGDLLFFKENNQICHVGIYNKNLRFIHSSGMVKENSLDEEDELFDKKLMDKFIGIFSISEIIKKQVNEQR
tara:strand:+ start:59 stop:736 length:678 start_codon:yes stop_codon:yes gene_type:complete